jgi:hypothetical protein
MMASHELKLLAALLAAQGRPLALGGSSLGWIGAMIGAVRHKHPIGGWLFFFLFQIYLGLAVAAAGTDWTRFAPRNWRDTGLCMLFTLTTLPVLMALAAVAAMCVMLLRTFEWQWVVTLRYALIVQGLLGGLKLAVDTFWFPSSAAHDAAALVFPCICVSYFYLSTRVRQVFGG